nr:MAG TPA: hypothetical protein [Caudoviricetes sp.]
MIFVFRQLLHKRGGTGIARLPEAEKSFSSPQRKEKVFAALQCTELCAYELPVKECFDDIGNVRRNVLIRACIYGDSASLHRLSLRVSFI